MFRFPMIDVPIMPAFPSFHIDPPPVQPSPTTASQGREGEEYVANDGSSVVGTIRAIDATVLARALCLAPDADSATILGRIEALMREPASLAKQARDEAAEARRRLAVANRTTERVIGDLRNAEERLADLRLAYAQQAEELVRLRRGR